MKKYRGKLWSLFLNIWKTSNLILTEKRMKLVSAKEIVQIMGRKKRDLKLLIKSRGKKLQKSSYALRKTKNKKNFAQIR